MVVRGPVVVVPALRLASSRLILGLRGRRAMAAATVVAAAARVPGPPVSLACYPAPRLAVARLCLPVCCFRWP